MVPSIMSPPGGRRLHTGQRFFGTCGRADKIDGDVRAFLGKPNGDRASDALRCAGDKCVLPDKAR